MDKQTPRSGYNRLANWNVLSIVNLSMDQQIVYHTHCEYAHLTMRLYPIHAFFSFTINEDVLY